MHPISHSSILCTPLDLLSIEEGENNVDPDE